jgi:hypothetical protein
LTTYRQNLVVAIENITVRQLVCLERATTTARTRPQTD